MQTGIHCSRRIDNLHSGSHRRQGAVVAFLLAAPHVRVPAVERQQLVVLPPLHDPARFELTDPDERFEVKPLEQVHFALAFETPGYRDDDVYTAQIHAGVLGGGMSSRLFQEVREKRGLAYAIFSFTTSYVDSGVFGVYAGANAEDGAQLVSVICDECKSMCDRVDEDEVARARAQLKAGLLMSLESSFSRCEQIARQMLIHGGPKDIDEMVARIDAVDSRAVRECMARLLAPARPTLATLGPAAPLPDYHAVAAALN